MLKIYRIKLRGLLSAVLLPAAFTFTLSCCASKKDISGNQGSSKNAAEKNASELTETDKNDHGAERKSGSLAEKSVRSFYDELLEEARKSLSFSGEAVSGSPVPGWLISVNEEKDFLYAIGISPKTAGEQRSRELALLDVQKKLYAHGIKKNYTHVSTYTQSAKNEEGKKYFVTAVLVRVPRENNQKNTEDLL